VVTKHRDVKEVSLRNDVFSAAANSVVPRYRDGIPREQIELSRLTLISMDEPEHARLRKIISRGFTPRAVARLRDELYERAQHIAETATAAGSGDFVTQVASELPLQAIAGLLGVPLADRKKIIAWSNAMVGELDPEFAGQDGMTASAELMMYAITIAHDRQPAASTTSVSSAH
jgi:cholest-4-en-3-one 26-monooxygenase